MRTYEQKDDHATSCVRNLGIEFTTVVDGTDYAVEKAYTASPDRFYLIDADGKILTKGAPGPAGFKATELEAAIGKMLGR